MLSIDGSIVLQLRLGLLIVRLATTLGFRSHFHIFIHLFWLILENVCQTLIVDNVLSWQRGLLLRRAHVGPRLSGFLLLNWFGRNILRLVHCGSAPGRGLLLALVCFNFLVGVAHLKDWISKDFQ